LPLHERSPNPDAPADERRTGGVLSGADQTKAKIEKCIPEYDANAISANRKAALEYCLKNNNYTANGTYRPAYDACMKQNDMLTALCTPRGEIPRCCGNPGPQPKGREDTGDSARPLVELQTLDLQGSEMLVLSQCRMACLRPDKVYSVRAGPLPLPA
jgi:hypothetical protein